MDIKGWVTPENSWEGLHKVADERNRKRELDEAKTARGTAKKAALGTMLSDFANPKDHLTGTVYDPYITDNFQKILNKGYELASMEGMDDITLRTALAPQLNKLIVESENLKELERQRKQTIDLIKTHKGINVDKFNDAFKKRAFFDEEGNLKDISSVDPTLMYNDEVLRNDDIYDNTGFDQFIKEAKTNTEVGRAKSINSRGGHTLHKAEITAPNFLTSEKDAQGNHIGFVPRYEIATEEGAPLAHEFLKDGKPESAPVRLLDKRVFNDLPVTAKAYLRQETKKLAKELGVPLNSIQAENLARALAYDELNADSKKWGTVKNIEEYKANPIRIYNNSGGKGSGGGEVKINDVYSHIKERVEEDSQKGYGTRINSLNSDASEVLVALAKKLTGDTEIGIDDIFLAKDKNGDMSLYRVTLDKDGNQIMGVDEKYPTRNLIGKLPKVGTNLKVQPNAKAKVEVVKQGEESTTQKKKISGW